jgi:hypothetical protein
MKKITFIALAFCSIIAAFGQKDPVEEVFKKYQGTQGYTLIHMNGEMINKLTESMDSGLVSKISQLRILTLEHSCDKNEGLDLRNEVLNKLDRAIYKEMITINQNDEDVTILVKESDGRILEMVVVVENQDNPVLIQVTGDIIFSEVASKFKMQDFMSLQKPGK